PVIAAARLRKGSTNSARGAARLVTDTLKTAAAAGADPKAGALVIARMDSAFFGHGLIAAVRPATAKFSVPPSLDPTVAKAIAAEATHRAHAVVEQVIADLKAGPLAHLPSGVFNANAAWLALASIAFNLLRAAGVLAAPRPGHGLAVATTATLRARLITIPAR